MNIETSAENTPGRSLLGERMQSLHVLPVIILVALVLVLATSLALLTKFPPVFIDEPWYANTAWNWLQMGSNIDPMHAEARPYAEWPYLGNLPLVGVFSLFGLGLFQARIVSWIFGILLLVATVITGRRSYSLISGMLGALFLALSWPFLQASHYARPDIMLAAAMVGAYALATKGVFAQKRWPNVAAGFLLAVALDIHLNAAVFSFGFGALYLAAYGRSTLRRAETWLFLLGVGLGFAVYGILHFDPGQDFLGILPSGFALGNTHQPPLMAFDLGRLLRSVEDEIGRYHFYENSLDFALIGASVIFMLTRHARADRLLLSFLAAVVLGFVLIVGAKHDVYAILLYPFFMLMVAEMFVSIVRGGKSDQPARAFAAALLLLFLASSTTHFVQTLTRSRDYSYDRISERLAGSIEVGSRVMAMPYWWLGLAETDFHSSMNLTFYHYFQGLDLSQAMEKMRPDFVITDDGFTGLLVDQGYYPTGAGFNAYLLPRQEFRQFMAKRARLLTEFEDPWHGDIAVYAINWSE